MFELMLHTAESKARFGVVLNVLSLLMMLTWISWLVYNNHHLIALLFVPDGAIDLLSIQFAREMEDDDDDDGYGPWGWI